MKFIDEVTVTVKSGKGGAGKVSFRRESMIARGGPDGGDGGKGGDVIFTTDPHKRSLLDLRLQKKYQAEDGHPGAGDNMTGAGGKDLIIVVPEGTVLKDEAGQQLVDLAKIKHFVFLKGGIGGKGNPYYKSSVNQAPEKAQKGMPGEERLIHLELKLIADVGIIGFPNAGKSTLISRISAAKPKVADYPFTTLTPNLGVVKLDDEKSFVVADIPGLVPGAHQGIGLGTQFLRHIERTKLFVHVIDGSEMSQRDPWQDYLDINNELKGHDQANKDKMGYLSLSERKQYVVLNKIDSIDEELVKDLVAQFNDNGVEIHPISAVSGLNIKKLIYDMGSLVFAPEESD